VIFANRLTPVHDKQISSQYDAAEADVAPRARRNEEAVDFCPRGGVIYANSVVAVRDKQFASGHCDTKGFPQSGRNEAPVDGCSGGDVIYADCVVEKVSNKQF